MSEVDDEKRSKRQTEKFKEEARLAEEFLSLAHDSGEADCVEEAVEACEKAVAIYKRLAEQAPVTYEPDLARSYHALGALYSSTRRTALASGEFQFGNLFSDTKSNEEAVKAYEAELGILKRLTEHNPAHAPDLAACYHSLGVVYTRVDRMKESVEADLKVTQIYKRLAEQDPLTYEPELANSYLSLAIGYHHVSPAYWEAEEAYKNAIEIYKRLAERDPEEYEHDLAQCYDFLASFYGGIRYADTKAAYENAIEIYKRLAGRDPARYEPNLADVYYNLADILKDADAYEEAIEAYSEAIKLYRRLAEREPEAFEKSLAQCYNGLGHIYMDYDEEQAFSLWHAAYEIAKKYPDDVICAWMIAFLSAIFEEEE